MMKADVRLRLLDGPPCAKTEVWLPQITLTLGLRRCATFLTFGQDEWSAMKRVRRISPRRLHIGGEAWFGVALAASFGASEDARRPGCGSYSPTLPISRACLRSCLI